MPEWAPERFLMATEACGGGTLDLSSFQKSRSRRVHSVWTPFDIPFLRNTQIGKKTAIRDGPPVSRLVPKWYKSVK